MRNLFAEINLNWLDNPATVAAGLGGTPPIPEWPSAHAMAGAAAAEAIAAGVPGTTAFTMTSTAGSGMPRSYPSLGVAVSDNNDSRIYVGYHWRAATTEGERLGRLVGRYIVEHSLLRPQGIDRRLFRKPLVQSLPARFPQGRQPHQVIQ